jgi:hypothetical protein
MPMNIEETTKLLNALLERTDKKADKKVYSCFIQILTSLKNRELSKNQTQLIQDKLTSFNLQATTENRKKYYKKRLSKFNAFLKSEFSFTPEKYYTELGMIYGMCFGTGIGLSIGTAINPAIGTSIGLSIGTGIGMVLGMIYGARKDAEAKKLGRVI